MRGRRRIRSPRHAGAKEEINPMWPLAATVAAIIVTVATLFGASVWAYMALGSTT